MRAASEVAPKQAIIVQTSAKRSTRRERVLVVALLAMVMADVLSWVLPHLR
jgi:hypothetical protein